MKKLRIAVMMLEDFVPPESLEGLTDKEIAPWKTEYDVLAGLEALGHDAEPLAVLDDLSKLREGLAERKPHIVFNLIEEFRSAGHYVPLVLGYLELIRQPYTGCNAQGLMMVHNKAMIKKVLKYHRIRVPDFAVFPRGKVFRIRRKLPYPLFVKSTTEHGSHGISQASIVQNESELADRVAFVHQQIGTDAIAEEYIDGREFYVGVLGNERLQTLPTWELSFRNLPEGTPRIATSKVKWDLAYQKKSGIRSQAARNLPEGLEARLQRISKRVYRLLNMTGYARLDFRVTDKGEAFLLEPNPNPQLEYGEDFAEAAEAAGMTYEQLLQRIVNLGLRAHRGQP